MAKISDHQSTLTTKLLFIGATGAGKTGALVSLARAGFNLRILDLDNGLDVLKSLAGADPEVADRIVFKTLTDPMVHKAGKLVPKTATVWTRAIKLLSDWSKANGADEDLGPITTWTPQDVLVIDSLTFLSKAALNNILALNGKLGGPVEQSHWFHGQELIESLLAMLYDVDVKCNVVINSHVTFIESGGITQGFPSTLGKALPPKVGRYFNSMLMAKATGSGASTRRQIHTLSMAGIELKNTAPGKVAATYPLETGLADYFRDLRKGG